MPIFLNDLVFYRAAEAYVKAGISRNTFIRWVRDEKIDDVVHRDRNGWRLFTEDDICRLRTRANLVLANSVVQKKTIHDTMSNGNPPESRKTLCKFRSKI
jgi:hypothetical protein